MTSTARWLWLLVPALAHAGCARAPAPGAPTPTRPAAVVIDSILADPPLHRAHWGIAVVDARSGAPVFQRNADKLFITASNMKLVTVAAALALLGPDYRFTTRVVAEGAAAEGAAAEGSAGGGGVARRLVVYGSGDPTLSRSFHDRAGAPLDSLADSLATAGLLRVDGPLVVDQRRFEAATVHPAWEVFDLDWYYAAPVAPFAVAEAAIPVVVRPGAPGEPARVDVLEVTGLVGVDAHILTGDGDRGWNDQLRRHPFADSLTLGGTIGAAAEPDTSWIAQVDPGRLAGRGLRAALERAGIEVGGDVVVEGPPPAPDSTAPWPPDAGAGSIVAEWRSPPLVEIIRLPLSASDNWVTEQLLKTIGAEMGAEGSWSAGTAAVETFLAEQVGIPEGGIYMRDGSGLTAQDLVAPATLVALLRWVDAQPWAGAFRDALAQPGKPESTLERRLLDYPGRVAAKTGTIRHVNALSGYATAADGTPFVFSLLSNGSGLPSSTVRAALDRILETLLLTPGVRP